MIPAGGPGGGAWGTVLDGPCVCVFVRTYLRMYVCTHVYVLLRIYAWVTPVGGGRPLSASLHLPLVALSRGPGDCLSAPDETEVVVAEALSVLSRAGNALLSNSPGSALFHRGRIESNSFIGSVGRAGGRTLSGEGVCIAILISCRRCQGILEAEESRQRRSAPDSSWTGGRHGLTRCQMSERHLPALACFLARRALTPLDAEPRPPGSRPCVR